MPVARYMGESNARYYASRDPLGAAGDFTTAPEISQMFGEMVGLWLADIWTRAGKSEHAIYVELGPGRGTLASDALRAAGQSGLVKILSYLLHVSCYFLCSDAGISGTGSASTQERILVRHPSRPPTHGHTNELQAKTETARSDNLG